MVVDERTYSNMAAVHISGDAEVCREGVHESQRVLSSTSKALSNILALGSSHSPRNAARCFDNSGSTAEDMPTLKILPKVHKDPGPNGLLQSRPVVSASAGLSSRAGDQLSDLLEPLVTLELPRVEDLSTEEVISQLEEAQDVVRSNMRADTVVGSLDVKALYPSLDQYKSANLVAKFVRDSKIEIAGVDWRQAQVFVASNMDPHKLKREKVLGLVPVRLKKFGPRPGSTTEELRSKRKDTSDPDSQAGSKWAPSNPDVDLSETDKQLLLSVVVKIATIQIFKHHCYQFNGIVYRQAKGGPIGLRFTSIVARIVMDHWIRVYLCAIVDAGCVVHAIMKYVDDINIVMASLHLGMRWVDGGLGWKQEWMDLDISSGRSMEDVTMTAMQDAANGILPWLQFTMDQPGNHDCCKVPVLDLQVWVRHPPPEVKEGDPRPPRRDSVVLL